ncbi:hypothetical protein CCP3SC1_450034 [Gammaproteobacteria bacterium]
MDEKTGRGSSEKRRCPLSSSPVEVVVAELVAPEAAVVTVVSEVIPPETAAAPAEIASANLDVLVPPHPFGGCFFAQ